MSFVTFVIPSMGRSTLARALESLRNQTDGDWKAIVCFDGRYGITILGADPRIYYTQSEDSGHAGLVRNCGIDFVDTEWMAFLDDDDWLEPTYVQKLKHHASVSPAIELFIFTYHDSENNNTVPHKKQRVIEECKVGISFAVKTDFINKNNIRFTPYAIEDFRFLDACVQAGVRYNITHDLQYHVGGRGGWIRKDEE